MVVSATSALAADALEQQQLVEKEDDGRRLCRGPRSRACDARDEARGQGLVHRAALLRGAFGFVEPVGGVLIVRDDKTKQWSEPAFYTIGSASFALQPVAMCRS
jgi:hypothetical protein